MELAENNNGNSQPRRRGPGRPFEKGQSGNPGGRPKGLARAVRDVPLELGEVPGDVLLARIFWQIVSDPKEKTENRIAAGRWIGERGWGKPAEFVPIEDADPLELSDNEAKTIAAEFTARVVELSERAQRKRRASA